MDNFKKYLTNEGKSKNTINGYVKQVELFSKWLGEEVTERNFTRNNILKYKKQLKGDGKTINYKLTSLKKYNEFLNIPIIIKSSDFTKIQSQSISPVKVREDEVIKFLNNVKEDSFRNYVLVILMSNIGLRISEALNLKLDDICFSSRELIIRSGKGNKQRTVYLNDLTLSVLRDYIDNDRKKYLYSKTSQYIFIGQKSPQPMMRQSFNKIFNKYSDIITPHQLRHFFATNMLNKGILDIRELASVLGHSDINTTMIYTHIDKNTMKNKINSICVG